MKIPLANWLIKYIFSPSLLCLQKQFLNSKYEKLLTLDRNPRLFVFSAVDKGLQSSSTLRSVLDLFKPLIIPP